MSYDARLLKKYKTLKFAFFPQKKINHNFNDIPSKTTILLIVHSPQKSSPKIIYLLYHQLRV